MTKDLFNRLASAFQWPENAEIISIGSGLIHKTWKIVFDHSAYILQQINHHVFQQPETIDHNIRILHSWLKEKDPTYLFISPVPTISGNTLLETNDAFFRAYQFISGSHSVERVNTADQAFEAARQFGLFTSKLSSLPADKMKITIPRFHDLPFRYNQFIDACANGNPKRIQETNKIISELIEKEYIVRQYEGFIQNPESKKRITHHDTKISNVLFNDEEKGLCVIDLDTVMPGYFISDIGDMLRTYICPVSEEEHDTSQINIRKDFITAVHEGYMSEMGAKLSTFERNHFLFSGNYMIYMQALRFLTDYLQNDRYYGAKYPDHNLVRAGNQIHLLNEFISATKNK